MQRNYRNELLTALGALAVLIFVVIAAVLLAGSDDDTPEENATRVVQVTEDMTIASTETATAVTPTASVTATADPSPVSPVNTASPTNTVTATDVSTAIPTATQRSSQTSTPTQRPSQTPSLTAAFTLTATATQTPTPVPTSTFTPTIVLVAQRDFGIVPTLPASPTPPPTDSPTREPSDCERPRGWTTYEVQPGNTLFAIALATRSTLDDLRYANCIDDVDSIEAEQILFVPREPVEPVATTAPGRVRGRLAAVGCEDPRTQITQPVIGAHLSGVFTVSGTATRDDFWYYKIEIRPDWAEIYNFYSDSYQPVEHGSIGQVNADIFDPGLHWLRLSVVDERAAIPPGATCEIPVIFE